MQHHLPDGDVVVDGLGAEHGEVDVDAVSRGHPDAPHTVLEVGVLLGVPGGVDGPVQGRDVAPAQSCRTRDTGHGTRDTQNETPAL